MASGAPALVVHVHSQTGVTGCTALGAASTHDSDRANTAVLEGIVAMLGALLATNQLAFLGMFTTPGVCMLGGLSSPYLKHVTRSLMKCSINI